MSQSSEHKTQGAWDARYDAIRNHDNRVISEEYRKAELGLIAYIYRNSGSEDEARDVLQDAWRILYMKVTRPEFEGTSAPSTYAIGIGKNLWLKHLDRYKKRYKPDNTLGVFWDKEGETNIVEDLETYERTCFVHDMLAKLQEECKKILTLVYIEEKSMDEIVDTMDLASAGYARQKKFRCMNYLKRLIGDDSRSKELFH